MEWSREKCLELIDEYENQPVLWNPQHKLYYNKLEKHDAWNSIEQTIGCAPGEARKKMQSILSSFRREKAKRRKGMQRSQWFAFPHLTFLLGRDDPKNTIDTLEEEDSANESELEESMSTIKEECGTNVQDDEEMLNTSHTGAPITNNNNRKRKKSSADNETLNLPSSSFAVNSYKSDPCSVYGEHVAHKLRSYSRQTRNIVQHHINNILFNADMGQFDINSLQLTQFPTQSVPILSVQPPVISETTTNTIPAPLNSPQPATSPHSYRSTSSENQPDSKILEIKTECFLQNLDSTDFCV